MNIFVGNLNYKVNESDLKGIFEEYGDVVSVNVITDKFTGRSRGFAFVEMANAEDAKVAIKELNGGELESRNIVVREATPKKSNGNPGGGGGRRFER
jgi:RNA recognition motif-containing protein